MPRLPVWLVLAVGAFVIAFGIFRIHMSFRSKDEDEKARGRGGLFGYPRRTHGLFGAVYILMGVLLILGGLGVRLPGCSAREAPRSESIEVQTPDPPK